MNKNAEKTPNVFVKGSSKGRGGKLKEAEFRSKKQKNELHILKMSQEWDLRRQQRRLDRQKWVEERRNQKLPIWQRVGNLRVQANEEGILHEAGNGIVNNKEHIKNSNEPCQVGVTNDDKVQEKVKQTVLEALDEQQSDPFRVKCARLSAPVQGSCGPDQKRDSTVSDIQFIKIEQPRTIKQPLQYNVNTLETSNVSVAQITEHGNITAFKSSSKLPTRHDKPEGQHCESGKTTDKKEVEGVHCPRREVGSVSIQKIPSAEGIRKEKKRKLEAILAAADIRQMPKLMCVDKPTTLESIARENGPVTTSNSTNNSSTMMRHSRGVLDQRDKGEESMPQIKQCYSLLDRREDDTTFFAKKSQNKSTSVAVAMTSSVTMTTAPSEAKGLPSNAVDPGCIVYISNSAPQTPSSGATHHSRPGYLVPVYKTNTREPAYAFLPAGTQRPPHRVGDKSSLEDRAPDHKSSSCTSVASANTRSTGSQFSTTGIKETHAASAPEKGGKIAQLSQPHPPLYRDNTSQNTRVHSAGYGSSTTTVTSAHINGGLPSSNAGKNHIAVNIPHAHAQQHKTATYVGTSRIPREEITGSPQAQDNKSSTVPPDKPHCPSVSRTSEAVPNQESIFNPMSLYVRARLVPREVVTVNHGTEPSPPLVEYIKTDAICDKELTKWNAKNVADFIAATDCRDKAELFLEEEIDGKALLSLSPEMLMKGMNLKLGPAVKLYNHIANLRTALLL